MQYIVILSLLIILCISIYLSSLKQIESFQDGEEEKTENYLRQYKNKLDTLKKLLEQYAKDAENNFIKARETNNQTSRKSLATRNNTLFETVSILTTLPLMVYSNVTINSPEYTMEVLEKEIENNSNPLIKKLKSLIEEKETVNTLNEQEDEDEEEDIDDDNTYEKVVSQEKAAEAARLAEEEAERIRAEEEIRIKEEIKKEEIATTKQSLINKFNDFDAELTMYSKDNNVILINMILTLMCKISRRLKTPSIYFNSNDPNVSLADYNVRHKTTLHGFTAKDVEVIPSMLEWELKVFSIGHTTGVTLQGKHWLDLTTIQNPLDEIFPPLDTNKQQLPNRNADIIARYNGTYVPNRGVDNAMYRFILIYKDLYKNYIMIEGFKKVQSSYDYTKLKSDMESVPDDLEKIKQLNAILDTKILKLSELLNNFKIFSDKINLYAWYIMYPFNWEPYYLKTKIPTQDELKNLFCCHENGKCITDYQDKILPVNWTFYLRKA